MQWQSSSNPLQFDTVSSKRASFAGAAGPNNNNGYNATDTLQEEIASLSMDFVPETAQVISNNTKSPLGILTKTVPSAQPFTNINISKDLNAGKSLWPFRPDSRLFLTIFRYF